MNKPAPQDTDALLKRLEELEAENRELRAKLHEQVALSEAKALHYAAAGREYAQEMSSANARIETLKDTRSSLQASEKRLEESETRARASEKQLRQIADNLPALIAYVDADQRYRFNNHAYVSWFGRTPESLYGVSLLEAVGETGYERVRPYVDTALRGERTRHEWWAPLPSGLKFVRSEYIPDQRDDGSIAGFYVLASDLTESKRSQAALAESEARLRLAIDAGRMAVWETDTATDTIHSSPELNRLLGFEPDASPSSAEIRSRYAPGEREKVRRIAAEALRRGERHAETELEVRWPDGSQRWLLLRAEMSEIENGIPRRTIGVALDITDRKKAEEHQQLLINELNHRVKNTLTTVQSIATQSLRNARTAEEARDAVEGRLFALSRAHDVLTRENWDGAFLSEVVQQAIEPFQNHGGERFSVSGPDIRLPPRIALAIAMAIQELGTNAVKYGALSNAKGCIAIAWTVLEEAGTPHLRMTWEETEGPAVVEPKQRGFGTRLVERSLAQELNGSVEINFAPKGVVCTINAPLAES
ncbi:sensor histidine kinase [Microvirga guangxiensis]|uniref:Blue-light-activated histidine kinase n=1 Tax=Microvirga guangxiensis TaxID=549386 RepID=A0A1G5K4M9_9HYPH|nr:HWE histidine kinase domain-containing protein [Microvirga guangxiensis]SCY95507.1 PAS domain S-box-containing protein [Microvirga guangxiensis]